MPTSHDTDIVLPFPMLGSVLHASVVYEGLILSLLEGGINGTATILKAEDGIVPTK